MAFRRLKSARTRNRPKSIVHDRTAAHLPMNASVRQIVVQDPYDERGGKVTVTASLRDDPLGRLHCRGQIDDAQYHAGRHYQSLLEHAEVGGLKAMDTTKEPVDGGSIPEVLTDKQVKATKELGRLSRALGMEGEALVRAVLGQRQFATHQAASQRERDYRARRLRECLETLARELGYA